MNNHLILSSWKNKIFHYVPQFFSSVMDTQKLLELFLCWANENKLSMNWTLHMHLLDFVMQQAEWKSQMNEGLIKELLMAAVTRWSLTGLDHVQAKGIMVASAFLPGLTVGLWKSQEADQPGKIVMIKLTDKLSYLNAHYAISYQQNDWQQVEWQALSCC